MLRVSMRGIECTAEALLFSPVVLAALAELGLLTEVTTVLLPPGGALEEEEEEDRPPSTESLSSKLLSATEEEKTGYTRELLAEFRNIIMTM